MASDAMGVPDDLKPLLDRHADVDWGSIAWDAVRARAAQLDKAEAIAQRSALRSQEARVLGEALREGP
jgi:hypothetical protein